MPWYIHMYVVKMLVAKIKYNPFKQLNIYPKSNYNNKNVIHFVK